MIHFKRSVSLLLLITFLVQSIYFTVYNEIPGNVFAKSKSSDSIPPSAPQNLTIENTMNNTAQISWEASTDDVGVLQYNVYVDSKKEATVTGLSYTIEKLKLDNLYSISVRAEDLAGFVSVDSNIVELIIKSDSERPSIVSNIR